MRVLAADFGSASREFGGRDSAGNVIGTRKCAERSDRGEEEGTGADNRN